MTKHWERVPWEQLQRGFLFPMEALTGRLVSRQDQPLKRNKGHLSTNSVKRFNNSIDGGQVLF
jgi:hypothetical protein